jgi:hypothetical protein
MDTFAPQNAQLEASISLNKSPVRPSTAHVLEEMENTGTISSGVSENKRRQQEE